MAGGGKSKLLPNAEGKKSFEPDGSDRYFADEELAAGAATGGNLKPARTKKASAA
jgi:hypothetical protein